MPPGAVIEVVAALRDELRSGADLRTALERAAGSCPDPALAHAVTVSRLGGDVATALRQRAQQRSVIVSLAALWQVSEGSGAALADALDRLVAGAEQSEKVRREVAAQLAGPRSTVRVLAALPLVGVGMGMMIGADPLGFLLGTVWGWGCLALATGLEVAGLLWMRRLVHGIESQL
jgi:tight adherence protein B